MTRWFLLLCVALACVASARVPGPEPVNEPGVQDCDSPDGALRVRISGDSRQAVLVDLANEEPAWMVLLARDAVRARFLAAGRLQLDLADGTSAFYELSKLHP